MQPGMQQLLRPTPHPVLDANGTTKYVLVSHRTTVGLPETHIMFNGSSKGGPCMAGGGPITAAVDCPGGPILAGDHRRRDSSHPNHEWHFLFAYLCQHCWQ